MILAGIKVNSFKFVYIRRKIWRRSYTKTHSTTISYKTILNKILQNYLKQNLTKLSYTKTYSTLRPYTKSYTKAYSTYGKYGKTQVKSKENKPLY